MIAVDNVDAVSFKTRNGTNHRASRDHNVLGLYRLLGAVSRGDFNFSRQREFRADAGGARLAGREKMLSGLNSLRNVYGQVDDEHKSMATLKISGHPGNSLMALMATHPPLEARIRRLETLPL